MNQISGRFSELHQIGVIKRNGERRGACAVWRLTPGQVK
jgi:hypothetical protein